MGEIADMMINGDMDFYTGEYMGRGNGIPRTLDKSLPWEKKKKNNLGGINHFCHTRGKSKNQTNRIIKRYGREVLNIETPTVPPQEYNSTVIPVLIKIAGEIQKDFNAFYSWFNKHYGKEKVTN